MGDSKPLVFEVHAPPSWVALVADQITHVRFLDPPILGLILFFVIWSNLFWRVRHNILLSSVQFALSCFAIYVTAPLNSYLAAHWQDFGFSRDYFDPRCEFALTFWAIPMIVFSSLILFTRFVDLCKSVAVHRYFNSIISAQAGKVKTE